MSEQMDPMPEVVNALERIFASVRRSGALADPTPFERAREALRLDRTPETDAAWQEFALARALLDDVEMAIRRARLSAANATALLYRAERNEVYRERNRCIAALSRLALDRGWPAGIARHKPEPDPNWDPDWTTVVLIDLPTGQVSWHVHDSDRALFAHLPDYAGEWDGHTTAQKYERLEQVAAL